MRNSFRLRLTSTYLILITVILFTCGLVLFSVFKDYYIKNVESNLIYETRLVAELIHHYNRPGSDITYLQSICNTVGKDTDTRVTIIDGKGKVLADSQYDAKKLGLHNTRPEVYQALNGKVGVAVRYSDTVKAEMIYVAGPFAERELKGAVRMAKPLVEVEMLYSHMWSILFLAILITGLIAFLISLWLAGRISHPLKEITATVNEMAQGDLQRRISYSGQDELGILAHAFNDMADYLMENIKEISQVKNRLEALLNNTVNGILMVDYGAQITYANPVALALLAGESNIINRKHVEVIGNYELIEIIDKVGQERQAIQQEIVLHTLGGKVIDVNAVPIMNNDATYQGILVVLNDITNMKRLEQVRKDFVANVSHELKTPVATISGFAETLVEEGANSPQVREFAQIIYDEAQRLSRLISRLLELSRLESENRDLRTGLVNMNNLLEETLTVMRQRKDCKNRIIKMQVPEHPVIVNGDADIIEQVLINLLDNAIKFSPEDESITIILEENGNGVKVSVEDHGPGIPEAEISRIFERFYRVDKTRSRKTGGTGLGLAIARHLVENHGGHLEVRSTVGQGSIFSFTLPGEILLAADEHCGNN